MKIALQTRIDRSEFFAHSLGGFGKPLQALLGENGDGSERGFSTARVCAEGCLGWIWMQWLAGVQSEKIRPDVEFVVNRGMEMQKVCKNQKYRGLHDLWLLNCAILASTDSQMRQLAEQVVDSNGDKIPPQNNGELFAAAWSGVLKYWILGDAKRSAQQLEIASKAYRYDIVRIAPKPLAAKWLASDWKGFAKEQQKDFKALWAFIRKHKLVTENGEEVTIAFSDIPVPGRGWCWSHCGLAMLAHRQGVEVVTDPFWFPPHALKCVASGKA